MIKRKNYKHNKINFDYEYIYNTIKKIIKFDESEYSLYIKDVIRILFESENGFLTEFNNGNFTFKDRQSLPKTYLPNGSIYIVKLENFIKTKRFLDDFTSKYLMTKKSSLDIDNFSDIIKANKEIKNLKM